MYGGGPMIVRDELNIYSRDLSGDLSKRRKDSSTSNIFSTQKQQNVKLSQ
jgi:hypothetical protein